MRDERYSFRSKSPNNLVENKENEDNCHKLPKKKRNRKLKENRKQNSKKRATFIDKDKEDSDKNAKI